MDIKKMPFAGETVFTRISKLAAKYGAVNIGQGFPDFNPSPLLMEIFEKKLRTVSHQYAPSPGLPLLREKISAITHKNTGVEYDPETEITLTPGATNGIFSVISATVGQGDKVIIFEPYYDSYIPCVLMNRGNVAIVPLKGNNADWEIFDRHYDSTVKAVIVNSPHNPTGRVMEWDFYLTLSDRLRHTNTIVISDEVYEYIVFDNSVHHSTSALPDLYERSYIISSFGKTFHVTGWKIGYVKAPKKLTAAFRNVYQFQTFSVNSIVQEVICEFLNYENEFMQLGEFYQKKRDYMLEQIKERTLFDPEIPAGTYFIPCGYDKISDLNDENFCMDLLKKHDVALIPMSPFYQENRNSRQVRFCFAKKEETIDLAVDKLAKVTKV